MDLRMEEHRMLDSGIIENRSQMPDERQKNIWANHFRFFGIWILIFGISAAGCVSEPTRTYGKEVVITYAQLTLLYEQEKMVNKLNDSTYQVKVTEFFRQKGIEEALFKKGVEEFSRNEGVWKLFIQDVSVAMDSLKTLQK